MRKDRMATRPQLPGMQWFLWLRFASLRIGVLTGIYLSCVLIAWLFVANRVPQLENFAGTRNMAGGAVVILIMAIPVLRFHHGPARMFVSGITAWFLFTFTYRVLEMRFSNLESRLGSLHFFMLGAVTYGFVSVLQWVFLICMEARQRHVAQTENPAMTDRRSPTH